MSGLLWSSLLGLLRNVSSWNGARTGDDQGGSLGHSDGLVVHNHMGRFWTVGGVVSYNNVGGDGDVVSEGNASQNGGSGDVGELHFNEWTF